MAIPFSNVTRGNGYFLLWGGGVPTIEMQPDGEPPPPKKKSVNDIEKVLCNSRCKKIKIALLGAPNKISSSPSTWEGGHI